MKIVISDSMEKEVVEKIKKLGDVSFQPENLEKELEDADALVIRSKTKVTKELLKNASKLKVVVRGGVGLDNVDKEACKEKGIAVRNTPGASSAAVAELVVGLMICGFRNIAKANIKLLDGSFNKKELTGREINGKTLGLVGYGRIGKEVASRAKALGMKVIAYDPFVKEAEVKLVGLDEVLAQSDVISLHTPATPETKGMINAAAIKKMKDGAFLVNTARGALVEEEALRKALEEGKLSGAALDVTAVEPPPKEMLSFPNTVFTGHLGASTKEAQVRIGEEVIDVLKEYV